MALLARPGRGWALGASLVLVLGLVISVAGCGDDGGNERPPQPGDTAAARVQDQTIWASDVKREAVAQGLIGEGEPLDTTSDLFRRVLDEVVDQKLLAKEAKKRGLDKRPLAQRRLAAARERILGDMLVENVVDNAIDENAVRALYNEQLRLAKQSEEIRARLILLKTEPEALAVSKLLATGASFEALAMERSIDQATRFNGGDLGYFTTDVMPEAYVGALKTAKTGDTVGPFQTEGGWAILKVEDRRQEQPLSLEEARPQILRFLTYDEVRQLLQKLRGQAKVQVLIKGDPLTLPGAPREPATAKPGLRPPAPATPAPAAPAATTSPVLRPAAAPVVAAPPEKAALKPAAPAPKPRPQPKPQASARTTVGPEPALPPPAITPQGIPQ
jgi:peptidyl-prolyl cis-trans isomerase C